MYVKSPAFLAGFFTFNIMANRKFEPQGNAPTVYFTEDGLKKLKDELYHLKNVERPKISRQIAEARDKGDLSENAEYDAAKEAQGMLELKISKMEAQLSSSRIIDESQLDISKVTILTKVKIQNVANGKVMEYTIVPANEADLKEGKISVETPIAKGLLGKAVGEETEIQIPSGKISFKILDISL